MHGYYSIKNLTINSIMKVGLNMRDKVRDYDLAHIRIIKKASRSNLCVVSL